MSENPALELLRVFFAGAGFQEVPPTKTYTRDDLVRAIVGQQWAVAIACHDDVTFRPAWQGAETWIDDAGPQRRLADLPCAHDVVEGMEQYDS
jgi:hypothetical protein